MNMDPENEMELEIRRLEKEWDQAQLQHDTEALDRLLSDDFLTTVGEETHTKAQVLEKHRCTEIRLKVHHSTPERVRVYGDAAVVVGQAITKGHYRGQDVRARSRYTRVYVKRGEGWRLVAAHVVVKWQ
jgi:uncharacterized protein (TIGR02246 family)